MCKRDRRQYHHKYYLRNRERLLARNSELQKRRVRKYRERVGRPIHNQIQKLTDFEMGYLSGFIDGEGSIGLYRNKDNKTKRGYSWEPRLSISNTNEEVLKWIKDKMNQGGITRTKRGKHGCKDSYSLELRQDVIRQILPLLKLRVKRAQQELLLRFLNITNKSVQPFDDPEIENIYLKLKALNARGSHHSFPSSISR